MPAQASGSTTADSSAGALDRQTRGGDERAAGSARSRLTAREVWRLILPYWTSEERWRALLLLAIVIALDLAMTYIGVRQTFWQKSFFDSLVERNLQSFYAQLVELLFIVLATIAASTASVWFNQVLEFRWRSWLTEVYLERWLQGHTFYRLEQNRRADNPDQRIADDLKQMASDTLRLSVGLLRNVINFFTFAAVIWSMSGALGVTLGATEYQIPGFLLWVAISYALIGSMLIEKIANRMVAIDYRQQQYEANFRYLLVRVREWSEQIAFSSGGRNEAGRLRRAFAAVRTNWQGVMTYTKRVTMTNSVYFQFGDYLPYLFTAPRYFAGHITVGGMMQLNNLFDRVQVALSWFIIRYKELAMLRAVLQRLSEFDREMRDRAGSGISVADSADRSMRVRSLEIRTWDDTPIGQIDSWEIAPGARWLIQGPSGSGKTSLLRVLAGLWANGSGTIERPAGARMFMPQRPYLPVGTLAECLTYPSADNAYERERLEAVLRQVGLSRLVAELGHDMDWMRRLSPGEQQRLAFARVLLQRPDFVFLDEATASLDLDAEADLYRLLLRELPEAAIVSVAHRPSLKEFHSHSLHWQRTGAREEASEGHAAKNATGLSPGI